MCSDSVGAVFAGVCPNLDLTLEVVGSKSGRSAYVFGRGFVSERAVSTWLSVLTDARLLGDVAFIAVSLPAVSLPDRTIPPLHSPYRLTPTLRLVSLSR